MVDIEHLVAELTANREARSTSVYASDRVYLLLDELLRLRAIEAVNKMMISTLGQTREQDIEEAADRLEDSPPAALDEAFFADFIAWNLATFGPGLRTEGTIKHIHKELDEIEANPTDPNEWVDVGILSWNGLLRLGLGPAEIIAAFHRKHAVNKARTWPDWRGHPDSPIEHHRGQDSEDQSHG